MCKKLAFAVFYAGLGCLALTVVTVIALRGGRPAGAAQPAEPCQIAGTPIAAATAAVAPAAIVPSPPASTVNTSRLPATGNAGILSGSRQSPLPQAQPCSQPTAASPAPSPTALAATATVSPSLPNAPGGGGGGINLPPIGY